MGTRLQKLQFTFRNLDEARDQISRAFDGVAKTVDQLTVNIGDGAGASLEAPFIVRGAPLPAGGGQNVGLLGPGALQQLVAGAIATLQALAMVQYAVPYGDTNSLLTQSLAKLGFWNDIGAGYLQALGINENGKVPFTSANYTNASIEAGLDLYAGTAGRFSVLNLQGSGPGAGGCQIWFTSQQRGTANEWLVGRIDAGDDGGGGHEGHINITTNMPGTTGNASFTSLRSCAQFYAGLLANSGGAAFPGGIAIGAASHGASNGMYDPTAGGPHIEMLDGTACAVARVNTGRIRYNVSGGFFETSSNAGPWIPISVTTSSSACRTQNNYSIVPGDQTILGDATAGNITITFPDPATVPGRSFTVKKKDASAHTVTLNSAGGGVFDGAASVVLGTQYQSRTFQSDGLSAGWWLVASVL